MLKKTLIVLATAAAVVLTPKAAYATQNCVTVYGGGVVCGAETEEIVHKPVETDLGDVNPFVLAGTAFAAAGSLFIISKRISTRFSINN